MYCIDGAFLSKEFPSHDHQLYITIIGERGQISVCVNQPTTLFRETFEFHLLHRWPHKLELNGQVEDTSPAIDHINQAIAAPDSDAV